MDRTASFLGALSPRVRRAVGMMLLAVIVVGATSLYFLHPWQTSQRAIATTQVKRSSAVPAGNFARYEFLNASVGWAVEIAPDSKNAGPYWIFKTVDGAKHWQKVLSGQSTWIGTTVQSLHFVDARNGFVAGGDPLTLHRSTDGGARWAQLELPMPDALILNFVDSSHGWLLAGPNEPNPRMRTYSTADGGSTWNRLPDGPSDAVSTATFRGLSEGWSGASGTDRPHVYLSLDGGGTWARRDLPLEADLPEAGVVTTVQLLPGSGVVAYVLAQAQGPLHTYTSFDEGATWRLVTIPSASGASGEYVFEDARHWWMFQGLDFFKTADSGLSWTLASRGASTGPNQVQVLDAMHAWGQLDDGNGAQLLFTSDGGFHWQQMNVPVAQ